MWRMQQEQAGVGEWAAGQGATRTPGRANECCAWPWHAVGGRARVTQGSGDNGRWVEGGQRRASSGRQAGSKAERETIRCFVWRGACTCIRTITWEEERVRDGRRERETERERERERRRH